MKEVPQKSLCHWTSPIINNAQSKLYVILRLFRMNGFFLKQRGLFTFVLSREFVYFKAVKSTG